MNFERLKPLHARPDDQGLENKVNLTALQQRLVDINNQKTGLTVQMARLEEEQKNIERQILADTAFQGSLRQLFRDDRGRSGIYHTIDSAIRSIPDFAQELPDNGEIPVDFLVDRVQVEKWGTETTWHWRFVDKKTGYHSEYVRGLGVSSFEKLQLKLATVGKQLEVVDKRHESQNTRGRPRG